MMIQCSYQVQTIQHGSWNTHTHHYALSELFSLNTKPDGASVSTFTKDIQQLPIKSFLYIRQAEDMHVTMDVNRRKQALQACSNLVLHEVDRERKTLEGIEKLGGVYRDRPSFADVGTRDEVDQRLNSVRIRFCFWTVAATYRLIRQLSLLIFCGFSCNGTHLRLDSIR